MKYHVEASAGGPWLKFTIEGFDTAEEAEEHRQKIIDDRGKSFASQLRVTPYHTPQERLQAVASQPGWSYERLANEVLLPMLQGAKIVELVVREAEHQAGLDHVSILTAWG